MLCDITIPLLEAVQNLLKSLWLLSLLSPKEQKTDGAQGWVPADHLESGLVFLSSLSGRLWAKPAANPVLEEGPALPAPRAGSRHQCRGVAHRSPPLGWTESPSQRWRTPASWAREGAPCRGGHCRPAPGATRPAHWNHCKAGPGCSRWACWIYSERRNSIFRKNGRKL